MKLDTGQTQSSDIHMQWTPFLRVSVPVSTCTRYFATNSNHSMAVFLYRVEGVSVYVRFSLYVTAVSDGTLRSTSSKLIFYHYFHCSFWIWSSVLPCLWARRNLVPLNFYVIYIFASVSCAMLAHIRCPAYKRMRCAEWVLEILTTVL